VSLLLVRKARAAFDVGRAVLAVTKARRIVARSPVGTLVGRDETVGLATESERRELPPTEWRRGERWGAAVDRALRWLPGDSACLVRATALRDLLTTDGARGAVVRIGVRRGGAGFEAHAWVELDGTPIAEDLALRGAFSSLEGVTLR
jgi:hypothetical protein